MEKIKTVGTYIVAGVILGSVALNLIGATIFIIRTVRHYCGG